MTRRGILWIVAWVGVAGLFSAGPLGCGDDDAAGGDAGVEAGPDAAGPDARPLPDAEPPVPVGEAFATLRVRNEAGGPQGAVPVTFGFPFRPGQVPGDAAVAVRLAGKDDEVLPTQVDLKARNGDGSYRHAVVTVLLPGLEQGQEATLEVVRADRALEGEDVGLDGLLNSGFDATVLVETDGTVWEATARRALAGEHVEQWLAGPLVSEWIAGIPLEAEGGGEHPHLTAWFHVRAYAGYERIRVDTILENTWTYRPDPRNYGYRVTVETCAQVAVDRQEVEHYRQARWRHTSWCGPVPQVGVIHDATYVTDTYAAPNFDTSLRVPEDRIQAFYEAWQAHSGLMDVGLAEPYMPMTGGRKDIGPAPTWNIFYLLTGDERARRAALGTADRSGAWPIHYRNADTWLPLTIEEYPYITILGNYGDTRNPETGEHEALPECGGECDTPLHPDDAHRPALVYLPYLLTGDFFYLEELAFWSNWLLIRANPAYREHETGLVKWGQVRGQAWSLRTLAETAYVLPDEHPQKEFFVRVVRDNLAWYSEQYLAGELNNPLHIVIRREGYQDGRAMAPWQDDFFTWAVGRAWELGFDEALDFLRWKAGFVILRMTDPGFCWIFASQYTLTVRDAWPEPVYDSMARVYEESVDPEIRQYECASQEMADALELEPGEMVGYSHSPEGYPSNLQIGLAVAVDSGAEGADEAWRVFEGRSVKPDYSKEPNFAVYPRSMR